MYEDYYCHHQTSTFSWPTFVMTRIKIILNHVRSKAKDQLEKWEQIMDNCEKLLCFIDVADHAMAFIILRITKNEQTKYFSWEVHLGVDEISLRVANLKTWHLMEKLSKWPFLGKITHYQYCLSHLVKIE